MNIENLTCVICGKNITKRTSYAYYSGRACKEHPEATSYALSRRNHNQYDALCTLVDYWRYKTDHVLTKQSFENVINGGCESRCKEVFHAIQVLLPTEFICKTDTRYSVDDSLIELANVVLNDHNRARLVKFTYQKQKVAVVDDDFEEVQRWK